MIGLQPGHIVIIILIAILIFAPTRLHQLIRGFKSMSSQFRKELGGKNQTKNIASDTPNKPKA